MFAPSVMLSNNTLQNQQLTARLEEERDHYEELGSKAARRVSGKARRDKSRGLIFTLDIYISVYTYMRLGFESWFDFYIYLYRLI